MEMKVYKSVEVSPDEFIKHQEERLKFLEGYASTHIEKLLHRYLERYYKECESIEKRIKDIKSSIREAKRVKKSKAV